MNEMKFLDEVSSPPPGPAIGLAVAALVLGIVSTAMSVIVTGFIFGLVGLILGIIALRGAHKPMAGWGIGLSLAGMLFSCVFGLIYYAGVMKKNKSSDLFSGEHSLLNKPAPDFNISDVNGSTYKLSSLKGRGVWLNLWDPYELQSRDTANLLSKLQSDSQSAPIIIGLSFSTNDTNELADIKNRLQLPYRIATADEANFDENYDYLATPATIFIGADGLIYDIIEGFHDSKILSRKASGLQFNPTDK